MKFSLTFENKYKIRWQFIDLFLQNRETVKDWFDDLFVMRSIPTNGSPTKIVVVLLNKWHKF